MMLDRKTLVENLENVASAMEDIKCHAMAQDVRDAIAEIKQPTFVWSSERPTVPGLYLVRTSDPLDSPWLLSFNGNTDGIWYDQLQFAGPITVSEPEDRNQS